jgi:uncharacterized protein (TIGR02266 family)
MATRDRRKGRPDTRKEAGGDRRGSERRLNPRVAVQIWVEERQGGDLYFQQAGNLSLGGVYFNRTIPHPIGTQVKLRFQLPGQGTVIETAGEVVSSHREGELGAGIRFLNLDPVEERAIRAFVEESLAGNS